jgi:hypothetical protein
VKLKDALATLDIDMDLDDGDMLTDVLVIAKVSRLDGPTSVLQAATEGTDEITRLGLVAAAHRSIAAHWEPYNREEDR